MAAEVAPFGIRVTLAEPGAIATDWAGKSMRFSTPIDAYDELRENLFGSPTVPWPAGDTSDGTPVAEVAAALLAHVQDPDDARLRLLIGADAPGQVGAALDLRLQDYGRAPGFD